MGPQVDLAFCGNGQLTESHKIQFAVFPVDIMVHPVDRVHCGHFPKHLAVGKYAVWPGPVDRVYWPVDRVHLAGRLGTLGRLTGYTKSVPCGHFCSQLAEAFMCARSTSWGMMSTGNTRVPHYTRVPHFSQNSALFIFHQNFIKPNPDLHWSSPNFIHTSHILISSRMGHWSSKWGFSIHQWPKTHKKA